jgi:hypothetical protein
MSASSDKIPIIELSFTVTVMGKDAGLQNNDCEG